MTSPPLPEPAWLYRKPSWLQRLALGLVSALALVAAFAVASVLFAVLLVIGLVGGAWLWWRYRKWVRRVREAQPAVLEGEYRVEPGPAALEDRAGDAGRTAPDQAPADPRAP